jgi:hypothetical protein
MIAPAAPRMKPLAVDPPAVVAVCIEAERLSLAIKFERTRSRQRQVGECHNQPNDFLNVQQCVRDLWRLLLFVRVDRCC